MDDLNLLPGLHFIRSTKGSATVLVTVGMITLIGFCSLVVDMGHVFLVRHQLTNALDAAALAAAQELPDNSANALAVAETYFNSHGVDGGVLSGVDVSSDLRTVTVSGQVEVNYFLAGVMGFDSTTVSGSATARIAPLSAVRGVVPVGIEVPPEGQSFQFGAAYDYNLKLSAGNSFEDYLGPGNFGCLDFQGVGDSPGSGSNEWRDEFKYGNNGVIKVGDVVKTIPGNRSGPAALGVSHRLGQCDHDCIPTDYDPSCPRVIIVPVYEKYEVQQGQSKVISVRIVGFAAFLLKDYTGQGNESYIKGHFLQMVVEGEGGSGTGNDFGSYAVKLIA